MLAVHEFVRLVPGRNAVAAVRAPSHPRRRRPPKYGALALLRHGLSGRPWPRAWPDQPLRNSYGIWLKRKHAKFPQPELGPWRDDSPTVGEHWQPATLAGWEPPQGH